MISVFEKLQFVITNKLNLNRKKTVHKSSSRLVRILRRIVKTMVTFFVLLFVLGTAIYYFGSPTIYVTDAREKIIYTDDPHYMIKGHLTSSRESHLKINNENIEMIGSDYTFSPDLNTGDNKFIFEAYNSNGVAKEIYVVHLSTK